MEENKNNLPIEQKRNKLINNATASDRVKRTLKIAKGIGIGLCGIAGGVAGGLIAVPAIATTVSAAGFLTTVYGLSTSAINTVFRNDKDLMFTSRKKLDGRYYLFQKTESLSYTKGLTPYEIAGLMTLNTIVGLSRYQQTLHETDSKMVETVVKNSKGQEDKLQVFKQGFATKTHSINIKNFKILQDLGYIAIDSEEPAGKSKLLIEKMTVGNTKGLRENIKQKQEIEMSLIKFRLTDKKINLKDFYKAYKTGDRVPGEKRIGKVLFDEKNGILRDNNPKGITINYDKYGREIIEYKSNNPGLGVIKNDPELISQLSQKENNEFMDRIIVDEKEQAEANIQNRIIAEKMKMRAEKSVQTKQQLNQVKTPQLGKEQKQETQQER